LQVIEDFVGKWGVGRETAGRFVNEIIDTGFREEQILLMVNWVIFINN
jgi:hypothetical protein